MDNKNLDLKTLEHVKRICDFQSDLSSRTLGYKWLERKIEELKSESQNSSTSTEALHIGDVVGRSKSFYCDCGYPNPIPDFPNHDKCSRCGGVVK